MKGDTVKAFLKEQIVARTKCILEEHKQLERYQKALHAYQMGEYEDMSELLNKIEASVHKDFGYYDAYNAHAAYQLRNLAYEAIVFDSGMWDGGD